MTADNIANVKTPGYKANDATFSAMVNEARSSSGTGYSAGGVTVSRRSDVAKSGLVSGTGRATDFAIEGSGFFPVASADGRVFYTRNGNFDLNTKGELVNNGFTLLGWATDANGTAPGGASAAALVPISINRIVSSAAPTTKASFTANLPANTAKGATFASSMETYDSLGTPAQMPVTWARVDDNTWTVKFGDPVPAAGTGAALAQVSSPPITVKFGGDGTLATVSPTPPTVTITGWKTGAADSTIALDFGVPGTASGLSQYASTEKIPGVSPRIVQDGKKYGTLSGTATQADGTILATFTNGQTRPIFKIPVATFANPNALSVKTGAVYQASSDSGAPSLRFAGNDGAGQIKGGALEESTADVNEQFANMISAQQAYSAAAKVVATANEMYKTLLQAVN